MNLDQGFGPKLGARVWEVRARDDAAHNQKMKDLYGPWLEDLLPRMATAATQAAEDGEFEFNFEIMPPQYQSFWSYLFGGDDRDQCFRWLEMQIHNRLGIKTGYYKDWCF